MFCEDINKLAAIMKRLTIISTFVLISTVIYSQDVEELIRTGDEFLTSKKYSRAVQTYTEAINLDTTMSESYFKRGKAYFFSEMDAQAIKDYDKALSIDPYNAKIYYMRGRSRSYIGDTQGAIEDYGQTIMLDSNFVEAYVRRAYVFLEKQDFMSAFVFFTKAIEIDSDQPAELYFARGYCYSEIGAHQQALDDYAKAISLKPDYTNAYLNSGNSAYQLQQFDKAFGFYEKALELNPSYPRVFYARGYAHLMNNNLEKACADWSKAVDLGSPDARGALDKHCEKE